MTDSRRRIPRTVTISTWLAVLYVLNTILLLWVSVCELVSGV